MRKLFVWEFMTLDGVMGSPEKWVDFYSGDDVAEFVKNENLACEALILGRMTYEAFITFWPLQTHNEFGFAEHLNRIPKYVVSATLEKVEWNNSTVIHEEPLEEIRHLKERPGGAIGMTGSATLLQSLARAGLIDEFHLLVHPVVLGKGLRLFEGEQNTHLRLVETRAFSSGVVLLSYQPAPV